MLWQTALSITRCIPVALFLGSNGEMIQTGAQFMFLDFFTVIEIAKTNEEKFKKMKDIYTKLREEHVQVLKQVCVLVLFKL